MECLIIGINNIFPVKLLKLSLNGNFCRETGHIFYCLPKKKESESGRNNKNFYERINDKTPFILIVKSPPCDEQCLRATSC